MSSTLNRCGEPDILGVLALYKLLDATSLLKFSVKSQFE